MAIDLYGLIQRFSVAHYQEILKSRLQNRAHYARFWLNLHNLNPMREFLIEDRAAQLKFMLIEDMQRALSASDFKDDNLRLLMTQMLKDRIDGMELTASINSTLRYDIEAVCVDYAEEEDSTPFEGEHKAIADSKRPIYGMP